MFKLETTQTTSESRTESASDENPNRPSHIVQHTDTARDGTEYKHRYGAAWTKDDGDIDIKLDGLPVNGRLTLTPMEKLERLREERQTQRLDQGESPDIGQP